MTQTPAMVPGTTEDLNPRSPLDSSSSNRFGNSSTGVTSNIHVGVGVVALAFGAAVTFLTGGFHWGWGVIVALISYCVLIYVVTRKLEGRRQASNRLATALVTSSFVVVLLPLASVVWTVASKGWARFNGAFFTNTMRITPQDLVAQSQGTQVGGAYHAIIGTLIVTGLAALMAIPFGLFTAIYLVEYGRGRLARAITSLVDVMTGIPSIVAGLFAYALFVIFFGAGTHSGISASVALTVLMTPVVVRSAEEMLKLVPNELREASYALGIPKWKTIAKVVLPTAIAGILTGITLAVARVIGETAPLLVTAGVAQDTNFNPFRGRMTTLPVFTYNSYKFPTQPPAASIERAWAAALTLVVIVAVLFAISRILASALTPKGLR